MANRNGKGSRIEFCEIQSLLLNPKHAMLAGVYADVSFHGMVP